MIPENITQGGAYGEKLGDFFALRESSGDVTGNVSPEFGSEGDAGDGLDVVVCLGPGAATAAVNYYRAWIVGEVCEFELGVFSHASPCLDLFQ
ncbi:hypothetical protein WAI453_003156 [Rhynchosporium graminicola]